MNLTVPVLRTLNLAHQARVLRGENRLRVGGSLLRHVSLDIRGSRNSVIIGDLCRLTNLRIVVRGDDNRIVIGSRVRVNTRLELWVDDGSTITIADGSTFESAHIAATERSIVRVGQDCMFATDIEVRTGDSHAIVNDSGERLNPASDVVIGDHVWVAARALVLKGVHLPDGCIVGAGSVVTKPVRAKGTVIVGNPAAPLKEGVRWNRALS